MATDEGSCCGGQLALKKFGLSHEKPELFVHAQCFHRTVYLVWRSFWAVAFVSMLAYDTYENVDKDFGAKYLTFLTNLTFMFQNATLILDFAVACHVHYNRPDIVKGKSNEMTWYLKILWTMTNVTNTMSLMVSIYYYSTLNPRWTVGSITTHMVNSIHTLLSLLFTAKPVQILHFYQPMIYAILYFTFTIIYHILGGDKIYDPLDWEDIPITPVGVALSVFISVPLIHILITFGLYTVRLYVHENCCHGCQCGSSSRVRPYPETIDRNRSLGPEDSQVNPADDNLRY